MQNRPIYSELEERLLKENFVTPEDMAAAKETRRQNLARAQKPLGWLISDIAKIPPEAFNGLVQDKRTQAKIGSFGLQRGLITPQQLDECQNHGDGAGGALSDVLVASGYLTEADRQVLVDLALDDIDVAKTGLVQGLIGEQELERALKCKSHQKSVCEILHHRNLVTLSELNHVFRKFRLDLKLGQILLLQELLTAEQLKAALVEQSATALRIGNILLQRRYVAIEQLYFALSIQHNTPFQKLDGYVYSEKRKAALRGLIGQGYALENRILPLFQNGSILTLAVSNPTDIGSMHGLKSLYPELQMTCVLITDEKFCQLYAMLYGEMFYGSGAFQQAPAGASDGDQHLQINRPADQKTLMKKLYEAYRYYQDAAGMKPSEGDEPLFYAFIEAHHQHICDRYRCNSVRFRFDIQNGRTEILASPVI